MCEFCGNRDHSLFVEGTATTPTAATTFSQKPVYSVDQVADFLTEGYWGGTTRSFRIGEDREISYNFDSLSISGRGAAQKALDAWAAVSGLNFVYDRVLADITFDDADPDGAYADSWVAGERIIRSNINIPSSWALYGDYYLQTFIHEIGHALGLGHSGDYNGEANYDDDAAFANDSWQMSIMSYFAQDEAKAVDASFAYVATPQIADIAAIQNLYGVPTKVESDDTTYGDGNTTGRSVMDLDHDYASTIVDSGGIDHINLASRSSHQNLSLIVDTFSDLNGKIGNFAIGRGTVIENASTGSGNDTIFGNAADNVLKAGEGHNYVDGGTGNNQIVTGTGNDTITAGDGNDTINSGDGANAISAGDGNNHVQSGNGNDQINTGTGADTILSGEGNDTVIAGDGNDHISASAGNNQLNGGEGDDTLVDGTGRDTLLGGSGDDLYIISTTNTEDTFVELADGGTDTVRSLVSWSLRDYSQHIENLTLQQVVGTNPNNNATGNGLANTLTGNRGNNILNGAWGNDTLIGGEGHDTFRDDNGADLMDGGSGNDAYYVDHVGDRIVENAEGGWDSVFSSIDFSLRDASQNIEVLTLTGNAVYGTGNGLDNIIRGQSSQGQILNGAWGDDVLYGGVHADIFKDDNGADTMSGGAGNDAYYIDNADDHIIENAGEGRDSVYTANSLALRDLSQFLEDLWLTGDADINGAGNGRENQITGNSGNNILNGAWGNDTLIGGEGNDTFRDDNGADAMYGGAGDDTYHVDHTGDQVFEGADMGLDQVISSVDFSLRDHSQHIEVLTLTGRATRGTGNGLDNIIYGYFENGSSLNGAWGNDTLYGGDSLDIFRDDAGADLMVGGNFDDIYYVDNVGDRIIEHAGDGTGWDEVHSYISLALRDLSQNLEDLRLQGTEDLNGTGNGKDNWVRGNRGDNILNGAWGDDEMWGGSGNDTFRDDGGNDTMSGESGADTFVMIGHFGNDIITDFDVDQAGEQISFAENGAINSWADLFLNHTSQVGDNTVIDDGMGNTLTLTDITLSDLSSTDFLF